ncbi:EcoKI restriction-modification system protein HsdS [Shewanella putrefaciens]|uniref:restriction endonuclease subunit S n=1 Tax=Shewanella putrefaciens TaxID=24 RepID=UPI000DF8F8A8|nr:restriction endonuclease subunit S [Shewanella putrefaciens]SUI79149.1 EcoKI restriction-modification system protein HsdS [Shewanella putrefaciens]
MSWPLVNLSAVCQIDMGSAPKGSTYVELDKGVPLIAGAADYGDVFPRPKKATLEPTKLCEEGDIIICVRATIGDLNWADKEYCLGRGVAGLRVHDKKLDSKYLWYFIASIEDELYRNSTGSTFPQINKKVIESLKIPLPPLEIQKQIAAVLEKADQLRKDCQQMEQELNSLAQSVFIEMFGDPVTNPKGWVKRELSEMLSVKHGFAFKSEFFTTEGEYVLLTPGNFKEEGGYLDRGEKQKYYVGKIPKGYLLEKNDLLLAMTEQAEGLLGSSILVPESNKYLHNQRLGLIKFKDTRQNAVFYSYLFNSKSVRFAIHSSSTGTKVKHTSPTKLEAIQVGVPPIALQNKFESIIRAIEKNIVLNNKAKSDYEQSFNALMQKAFNVELNLVNAKT